MTRDVTHEEQAELKRELTALDSLLTKLMPEDDLARLVLDPKRQAAAAVMVGTITLARDLLARMRKRVEDTGKFETVIPTASNGRGDATRGRAGAYVMKRLERASEPLLRNQLANDAVAAGHATAATTVYGVVKRLVDEGRVKLNDAENTLELVR